MEHTPHNILCPHCNIAVKEYHRHCPYCGGDLRRKINIKHKRFSLWKAAIIALPLAALLTIYLPLDSISIEHTEYTEYILPLLFILSAAGLTVVVYLAANIILYALRWIKNR
jgi:hypothetical protein